MASCKTVEVEVDIDLDAFDDDDLKEEMEARGFLVEKDRDCFTCYPAEWDELARLVAFSKNREALELMQYISGGHVNVITPFKLAVTLQQSRVQS